MSFDNIVMRKGHQAAGQISIAGRPLYGPVRALERPLAAFTVIPRSGAGKAQNVACTFVQEGA